MGPAPPEDIHRALKARAAEAGMSLSEYLQRDPMDDADRPTMKEMIERIRSRPLVDLGEVSTAGIIREEREERANYLADRHRPGL
jgi:hypothetical protein